MIIQTYTTRLIQPPKDDLLAVIKESLPVVQEKSILVITSKVVSIWQGRCIPAKDVPDRDALIIAEADRYVQRDAVPGKWVIHTLKNNVFIPSSGIDESNANNHFILWPDRIQDTAKELHAWCKREYNIKDVGILITDSRSIPLRRGVVGMALGYYGFVPLKDYRQTKDLFGRELKVSQTNIADGLAAGAVTIMGEGKERTPIAVISDIPWVTFTDEQFETKEKYGSFEVKPEEDMFGPFLSGMPWQNGGKTDKI